MRAASPASATALAESLLATRKIHSPAREMAGLVALDTVVGSIPILGSVFDLFFKANNANLKMLRRHLASRGRALPPALRRASGRRARASGSPARC